jgi:triacylglycerol lipase
VNKPVPPAKFSQIVPPNANYTYFEDKEPYPFNPNAIGFDLVNAGWLADFALLAYGEEDFISGRLEASGLTAAGFAFKFFTRQTTQCFVAHNEAFAVLSFRGTEIDNFMGAFADWARNLDFKPVEDSSGGRVHRGFAQNIAAVWDDTGEASLRNHLQRILESGTITLWITGHSLGAALAVLAAERAVREADFVVNGVYAFGCPRIGDGGFKDHYTAQGLHDRTYRFVNDLDVVRRLPPGSDYQHVGKLKLFDANGIMGEEFAIEPKDDGDLPQPTHGQERAVRMSRLMGRKLAAISESLFDLTIPAPFADHAPIYYAVHSWNNLFDRNVN